LAAGRVGPTPLRGLDGRVDVALGGQQHGAAPDADSQHPGAVEPGAVVFQGVDQRLGLGEPTQLNQGLDGIATNNGTSAAIVEVSQGFAGQARIRASGR
jgi:hypothetical protein